MADNNHKRTFRTYKHYFQCENPSDNMPKATKWRVNKRVKQSSDNTVPASGYETQDADTDDIHSLLMSLNDTGAYDDEKDADDPAAHVTDAADNLWFSNDMQQTWFDINEESVWFDALEDLQSNESEQNETASANSDTSTSDDLPIYQGAPISVAQSAILILTFALRHNLTGECLSDLLTLISLHCITTTFLHKSLYKFRSYFSAFQSPLVFHKFCSKCEILTEENAQKCTVCSSNLSEKNSTSYFVEIPLLFQVQQFFQRSEFHKKLKHRFNRKKKAHNNIEDIYDGELYKKFSCQGGFLNCSNNLSLMWYTDGVPLFKSSKISIWPLFFSVNELPIQERFKQENMLFAGIWFGRSKPSMHCFLKPFNESLTKFRDTGFEIHCSHCASMIVVKGLLLCGTCDLPAKCMVMNMTQFNGKHGCPKCKQEGNVRKIGKGHTRVFPFDANCIDGPKRDHEEFIQHGDEAFATSKPVFGVKGPSWWTNCCPDIINGTAIDYMHAVLLGIVRRLLQLWFDPKFSSESFSISNQVHVADRRLLEIKPPYFINRHPRDIKEQSKYWKASECRAWLFFYSVPVLFGLLKNQYFQHYLLLVEAIYILNLESISSQDLLHCEEMLIKFSCIFSALYGDQHMSANLHQLIHLHDTVKQLGPLWVYSCFSFESTNGRLVSLFHGTQNPVVQIANAVSTMLKLPALSSTKIVYETEVGIFFQKLNTRSYHHRITETIFDGAYIVGKKHLQVLDIKYLAALSQTVNSFAIGNCFVFYRILLNGILYHSVKYNTHSRNSCSVLYSFNGVNQCGQIMFYVKVYPLCCCLINDCRCTASYFAIVNKFTIDEKCAFVDETTLVHASLKHIYTGKLSDHFVAIPLENIVGLGLFINFFKDKSCIILRPNTVESD